MNFREAGLYWIHLLEHDDPMTQGYIGVSKYPAGRMSTHIRHASENKHHNINLIEAIKTNGKTNLICEVLLWGSEVYCYELEHKYRPVKNIGWNVAEGGRMGAGSKFGVPKNREKIEANRATKRRISEERQHRIKQGNPTKEDIIFLQNIKEKNSLRKKIELGIPLEEEISDNIANLRSICKECNKNFRAVNYIRAGVKHYRSICDECGKKKAKKAKRFTAWEKAGYKKKPICDVCGFRSVYPTQMTVFHIDGDLRNVNFNNLRSICLNCVEVVKRRQVTWKRGDLQVDY
jgi:hypothetical protein